MKQIILFLLVVCAGTVQAQHDRTGAAPYHQPISSYGIEVTFAKTVHILFPSGIKYVDLGSPNLIAGKADGANNVLRVKATVEDFNGDTNFSVITEDGNFFSFTARYADEPEYLSIEMKNNADGNTEPVFLKELGNENPALVQMIMRSIYTGNVKRLRHLGCSKYNLQTVIKGIYVYNELFYFLVEITNKSNVPFDVDYISFKLVDKKSIKRTAQQETPLVPIRSYNEQNCVAGNSTVRTVFALKKFTFDDTKIMLIEWMEKGGGRHQLIRLDSQDINDAYPVTEIIIN